MDKNEIKAKLTPIFREVFFDDALEIGEETTAQDVPDWDSLAHINLIMTVEKSFRIAFSTQEVRSMAKVGDLIDIIHKRTS